MAKFAGKCERVIPTDRLDRDIYRVLEEFGNGPAWRETDAGEIDYSALIADLLFVQYKQPLRGWPSIQSKAGRGTPP